MFGILTAVDFLRKLEQDYAEFKDSPDSARIALNCIMTANHLAEWVWADCVANNLEKQAVMGIGNKAQFCKLISRQWAGSEVCRKVSNRTKHFCRKQGDPETTRVSGWGSGLYGVGTYGRPYLLIDHGEEKVGGERWQTVDSLLEAAVLFWQEFFQRYGLLDGPAVSIGQRG